MSGSRTVLTVRSFLIVLMLTACAFLVASNMVSGLQDETMVRHTHPDGYSLLVPTDWTVQDNAMIGGDLIDLLVTGPNQTNVNLLTGLDSAIDEDPDYLWDAANATIAGLSELGYEVSILEGPAPRQIDGMDAIVQTYSLDDQGLIQEQAIIVNEDNQTWWVITCTSSTVDFDLWQPTFEEMILSFQEGGDNVAGAQVDLLLYVSIAAVLVVLGVLVLVFYLRQKDKK